jgi:hypothetical protein
VISAFAGAGWRALVLGCGVALVAGCAALQQPDVEQVVAAFATGDPAARCALLAPATLVALERSASTSCARVVAGLAPSGGQVLRTSVWGDGAQVETAEDTVFLIRTSGGWKIAAAGCAPNGDAPYICTVDGP